MIILLSVLISSIISIKKKKLWSVPLVGDNTLIHKLTGYKPEYTLEQGLKETIEWFVKPENLKNYKAGIYNV